MTDPTLIPRAQGDSAWKEMLDVYFREFMEFFFPAFAAEIDWEQGYEMLDQELQSITKDAIVGPRRVDKLVKVATKRGEERWVMIHVEVQGKKESNFLQRLFEYYYRLHDRYQKPILTLVILADSNPSWRPDTYRASVWDHPVLEFKFFIAKLLDYAPKVTELAKKPNPFGLIVLAHLEAQRTKQDPQKRYLEKYALTRRLYERGLDRDGILILYKFVDWVMTLPEDLEIQYNNDIHKIEEELNVSYITSAERIGLQKGIEQGILQGRQEGEGALLLRLLQFKFKAIPESYQQKITQADANTLLTWGERVLSVSTLEEIFADSH
jgi:hypothetical protein